jgi:hypothetical protein
MVRFRNAHVYEAIPDRLQYLLFKAWKVSDSPEAEMIVERSPRTPVLGT